MQKRDHRRNEASGCYAREAHTRARRSGKRSDSAPHRSVTIARVAGRKTIEDGKQRRMPFDNPAGVRLCTGKILEEALDAQDVASTAAGSNRRLPGWAHFFSIGLSVVSVFSFSDRQFELMFAGFAAPDICFGDWMFSWCAISRSSPTSWRPTSKTQAIVNLKAFSRVANYVAAGNRSRGNRGSRPAS